MIFYFLSRSWLHLGRQNILDHIGYLNPFSPSALDISFYRATTVTRHKTVRPIRFASILFSRILHFSFFFPFHSLFDFQSQLSLGLWRLDSAGNAYFFHLGYLHVISLISILSVVSQETKASRLSQNFVVLSPNRVYDSGRVEVFAHNLLFWVIRPLFILGAPIPDSSCLIPSLASSWSLPFTTIFFPCYFTASEPIFMIWFNFSFLYLSSRNISLGINVLMLHGFMS
jgi:hypothetical protein